MVALFLCQKFLLSAIVYMCMFCSWFTSEKAKVKQPAHKYMYNPDVPILCKNDITYKIRTASNFLIVFWSNEGNGAHKWQKIRLCYISFAIGNIKRGGNHPDNARSLHGIQVILFY